MSPARNSSLCEAISASAGVSFKVGMRVCDQRIQGAKCAERTTPCRLFSIQLPHAQVPSNPDDGVSYISPEGGDPWVKLIYLSKQMALTRRRRFCLVLQS